jgi:hypothetical protein
VPTNRTPIRRPAAATITPRALEAFRRLVELEAQCVGPPECEPYKRCAACDQWWVEQWTIRRELGLKPWEFAVEREGTGDWPADEAVRARWRLFEQAAAEPEPRRRKRGRGAHAATG